MSSNLIFPNFNSSSVIIFFSIPNLKIFEQDNVLYFNENWINFKEIDFPKLNLSFEPVAHDREIIFDMAREVCNKKGNLGVIFNAANEIAVDAFINKRKPNWKNS